MSQSNRPDRAYVERICREEAAAANITMTAILNGLAGNAVAARHKALRRIKRETGCSTFGLATVFGCDHGAILDALRKEAGPASQPYDGATIARLRAAHGNDRAEQIIAGKDPKTNADLTAWKRLGGSPAQIEGGGSL